MMEQKEVKIMGLTRNIVSTVVAIPTAVLSLGAFSAGLLEPLFGLSFVFAGLIGFALTGTILYFGWRK
jgi:hypothetical protein